MASKLDEQEAALYLSMMQLHEALRQVLDRKAELQEKELSKQEDKPKCAHCKEKKPLELSCYQPLGEMVALCKPCEKQAEVAWFSRSWAKVTEAMEGSDEGSI